MRKEIRTRIFNEDDKEVFVGQLVFINSQGRVYVGKVSVINPTNIQIKYKDGTGHTIAYNNIEKLI